MPVAPELTADRPSRITPLGLARPVLGRASSISGRGSRRSGGDPTTLHDHRPL